MKVVDLNLKSEFFDESNKKQCSTIPVFIDDRFRIIDAPTNYVIHQIMEIGRWQSMHTIRSNIESIKSLLMFLEVIGVSLHTINMRHWIHWRNNMYEDGIKHPNSSRSVNVRLRNASTFIVWCINNGYIEDPFIGLTEVVEVNYHGVNFNQKKFKVKKYRINSLLRVRNIKDRLPTIDELMKFVNQLNSEIKLIAWVMLESGMRISEVLSMPTNVLPSFQDVIKQSRIRYAIHLKNNEMYIKNRKSRIVFFSHSLCYALWIYIQQVRQERLSSKDNIPTSLFISNRGKPWHPSSVQKHFKKACQSALLSISMTPHTMRHIFATQTLANWNFYFSSETTCLLWLKERLGHSHVSTTSDVYIGMVSELQQMDHEILNKYENDLLNMMKY